MKVIYVNVLDATASTEVVLSLPNGYSWSDARNDVAKQADCGERSRASIVASIVRARSTFHHIADALYAHVEKALEGYLDANDGEAA